jgi:pimeloyl-ACP methyl ester carboxylesterase
VVNFQYRGMLIRMRRLPSAIGITGIAVAVAALAIHLYPQLPPPVGQFHIGTVVLDVSSPEYSILASDAHYCPITVQLWYPAEPGTGSQRAPYDWRTRSLLSAERWVATDAALGAQVSTKQARYAVLLFFPGWDGELVTYTAIVQDLASRGFIVAAIGYDSADCALPNGAAASPRTTDMDFSSTAAFGWTVQVADTKITRVASSATRVLDALADLNQNDRQGRFTGRLDLGRMAAIGHSLGGAIALQIASLDARIKAAIDLDGWLFDAAPGNWTRPPFLVIGSDGPASAKDDPAAENPERRFTSMLDDQTGRRMHEAFARSGGVEVTIGDSTHEDFSDAPYLSRAAAIFGRRPHGHVIPIAVDCAVTFFESVFNGESSPSCETSNPKARIVVWHRLTPREPAN